MVYDTSELTTGRKKLGWIALAVFILCFTSRPSSPADCKPAMKITATIITLNEERNIARAIESLRCCDEILIVDSGSVDRTVELAEKLGVRVIEAGWRGYAAQKNWAAEQASHDWILSLDADEALSEALEAEIWHLKKTGPRFDAYTMPRLARYLGRWILHSGWYPDRKVRLYDRRQGPVGGRFRARERACRRADWGTWRATFCTSPANRFPST